MKKTIRIYEQKIERNLKKTILKYTGLRTVLPPARRDTWRFYMEYITVRKAAKKWKISDRLVQKYCAEGRIDGIRKFEK